MDNNKSDNNTNNNILSSLLVPNSVLVLIVAILISLYFFVSSKNSNNKQAMTKLQVGDSAPSFKDIPDGKGNLHSLQDYAGKILVLYFYPKSFTPGCTKQACEFRDKYEAFTDAGAVVIGVSSDNQDSQSKFQDKYRLPFPILSDKKGELAKLYGVEKELLILPGRTTFIIDKEQKIAHTYTNMFKATSHIDESLKIIEKIK